MKQCYENDGLMGTQRPSVSAGGLVVANDLEFRRCEVLVSNTQRMSKMMPHLIIINHEGRMIPNIYLDQVRLQ